MHLEQLQNTTANGNVSEFFNLFMIPGMSKFTNSFNSMLMLTLLART